MPPSRLSFFRLGLVGEMGPTNQPQQLFMPHRWEPPSHFSVFLHGRHRPPNSPGHRHPRPLGFPRHDIHHVNPLQRGCKYSKAILFMVRRSFCELSKTAFIPLYCTLLGPHLEYAMEANAPTLRVDIYQLGRVERLARRLVRGLRGVQ